MGTHTFLKSLPKSNLVGALECSKETRVKIRKKDDFSCLNLAFHLPTGKHTSTLIRTRILPHVYLWLRWRGQRGKGLVCCAAFMQGRLHVRERFVCVCVWLARRVLHVKVIDSRKIRLWCGLRFGTFLVYKIKAVNALLCQLFSRDTRWVTELTAYLPNTNTKYQIPTPTPTKMWLTLSIIFAILATVAGFIYL